MKMTILLKTVWEDMENYKVQKENFMGSVGPEGAAKHMTETVMFLNCFSIQN
jgi:hypothetical protein